MEDKRRGADGSITTHNPSYCPGIFSPEPLAHLGTVPSVCYRIEEKEETNIVYTTISESAEGADTGPLFQIFFTEEGGRIIYGGAVAGGSILCMLLVDK